MLGRQSAGDYRALQFKYSIIYIVSQILIFARADGKFEGENARTNGFYEFQEGSSEIIIAQIVLLVQFIRF